MTVIAELIHTTTMKGYAQGETTERERIVKLLENEIKSLEKYGRTELWGLHKALHLIKGETK